MGYRWQCPHEWLAEKAVRWKEDDLYNELMVVAGKLDHDDLQELYQDEMDADGYFDLLPDGEDEE